MNTGQSATAAAKVSKTSLKRNPLLKAAKMRSKPDFFTYARWAQYKKSILGFGKDQKAIVMESAMPISSQNGPQLTIIKKGLIHQPKEKPSHSDLVLSCLHHIAPLADVVLINVGLDRDYLASLEKGHLAHIEKARVINRSQAFIENSPSVLNRLKETLEIHIPEAMRSIKKISEEQILNLKELLETGDEKILVQAAGNKRIFLSQPILQSGSTFLYSSMKTMSDDAYFRKRLILAGGIGQRFAHTQFSAMPGTDKNLQDITLFTLAEDIELYGKDLVHGTSFAAPIISGSFLLLKEKFPTLTIFEIKEVLLESASKTFTIEDEDNLKKTTFVYELDEEKPNLDHFKGQENILSIKFNREVFGKGVLNLRAALIYGKLKVENGSLSSKVLRLRMKQILKKQQNVAATKIQALVRSHQARKRIDRTKKENSAATKIQALVRGHLSRKKGGF